MTSQGRSAITFTLNGHRYELTRADVERRLVDVAPDAICKHAVRVNDTWFPVIQAFELASGIPRSEFMRTTARRHLAALGYEIAGNAEPRTALPGNRSAAGHSVAHGRRDTHAAAIGGRGVAHRGQRPGVPSHRPRGRGMAHPLGREHRDEGTRHRGDRRS